MSNCSCPTMIAHVCPFFLFPSLRMIPGLTKRTPYSLPAALFLLQRLVRTMWSTTRTFGQLRNPKWGGRNESEPTLNQQTHICHSGWCFQWSSQWLPPQRGAARCRDLLCEPGPSDAVGFLYAECFLLKRELHFVVLIVIFSASTHFVKNLWYYFVSNIMVWHTDHTGIQSFVNKENCSFFSNSDIQLVLTVVSVQYIYSKSSGE